MPKPNTLTDRDRRIIQSAVSFRIICGVKRLGAADLRTAKLLAAAMADAQRRPALVYAQGEDCGAEAGAYIGSHCPKNGWRELE